MKQTSMTRSRLRTVDLAYAALFAVLLMVCAWITIPLTVPFTLQTFGVFAALGTLGGRRGTLAVLAYLLLGLVGLPVFSGFQGGPGVLLGTTGGYILGFLASALLYWAMTARLGDRPAVTAAASLILLDGLTRKSLCAVLGCVGGVAAAGLCAGIVGTLTPLNGFNMSEAENLILYGAEKGLSISGLLVCGVLIAALGAVMDVAMSIASAVWELRERSPQLSARELFRSGMNIGRDAMGTMANTLILAFAGSSLNLLILVQVYDIPFLQLVNTDFICIEVLQSVAGSMGILLTVPLVAGISARLMAGRAGWSA